MVLIDLALIVVLILVLSPSAPQFACCNTALAIAKCWLRQAPVGNQNEKSFEIASEQTEETGGGRDSCPSFILGFK